MTSTANTLEAIIEQLHKEHKGYATVITNGYDIDITDYWSNIDAEETREFGMAESTFTGENNGEMVAVPCTDIILYDEDGYIQDERWACVVSGEDYERLGRNG